MKRRDWLKSVAAALAITFVVPVASYPDATTTYNPVDNGLFVDGLWIDHKILSDGRHERIEHWWGRCGNASMGELKQRVPSKPPEGYRTERTKYSMSFRRGTFFVVLTQVERRAKYPDENTVYEPVMGGPFIGVAIESIDKGKQGRILLTSATKR
jgi:hypothetical protein